MRTKRIARSSVFFLIVFFAFSATLPAQGKKPKTDSLKELLAKTTDKSEAGHLCRQIASRLNESKPQEALKYADSAIHTGESLRDTVLMMDAHIAKGIALFHLAEFASALKCQTRALDLAVSVRDEGREASCYTNIGRIYSQQDGQRDREIEYYRKALVIREKYKDRQLPSAYLNMSTAYSSGPEYDSARYYAQKSINAVADTTDQRILAYGYNTMGSIYFAEKDYPNAIVWFEKGRVIKEQENDRKGLISAHANIGESYAMMGDFEKGIENLDIAVALAAATGNKFLQSEVYYTLSDVYSMKGDYKNAYEMYKMHTRYRDSIFSDQKSSEILELQEKFEATQKERENELLKNTNDIQAESIRRKDLLNYSVMGCLLLAVAGGIYIFYAYRQKRKANHEISRQKAQLEARNKEVFDSITYAKRIQYTLLANESLLNEHLPEHFVLFRPKDIVSGDFYWATAGEGDFYLAVCDSTGHGVPGAFMSLLNTSFLNEAVSEKQITDPSQVLNFVRERLVNSVSKEGAQDGMDGVVLRFSQSGVTYSAANNNPVVVHNGMAEELAADKMAIGAGSKESFRTHSITGKAGDMVFVFTDGYADQFGGPKGKKFKYKQLYELLAANASLPCDVQRERLDAAFTTWMGALEQVDDVCIVGFRMR